MNCDEYMDFVQAAIQNRINHYYSIQSRELDYLTSYSANRKIEALKELAEDLGVVLE